MGKFIVGCLAAIGAIVVVIAAGAFLIGTSSTSSRSSSSVPTSDAPSQQTFSVTDASTTYYGALASNVGVAVLGLRDAGPYLSGSFEQVAKADGKFILVGVAISNRQNTAITMDPNLFEILDSNSNVYSASEKSLEVGTSHDLFLARINPGVTKTGVVVFDVPQTLGLDGLRLSFRGGMTGESAVLPLKVNSLERPAPLPSSPATSGLAPQSGGDNPPSIENTAAEQLPVPSDSSARAAPAPTAISIGQTPTQVEAILGQPTSVTTGAKHFYTYPNLTVVFVDGKVSEIQQRQ